jgi:hypothetical protein
MDRVMKGGDMNANMGHLHEVDEEDPNRVAGEEEAADEIGIEEGIGTGEIDLGIPVGQREVAGEVVLDGVNVHGHETFPQLWVLVGVGRP